MHLTGCSFFQVRQPSEQSAVTRKSRRDTGEKRAAATWLSRRDVADKTFSPPGYGHSATSLRFLNDSRTCVHGPRDHLRPLQSASTIKVAGILAERRATARIPHILQRCFGSPSVGRAATHTSPPTPSFLAASPHTRRDISHNARARHRSHHQPLTDPEDLSSLLATVAKDDGLPHLPQTQRTPKSLKRPIPQKTRPSVDASVPPVMAGGSPTTTPHTPRTVHILGHDRRAGFLACELQHVYDSVHVLKSVDDKLVDFKYDPKNLPEARGTADAKDQQQEHVLSRTTSEAPISKLITTARAVDTVSAVDKLKHRFSDKTTLCLMNDGLGVAEELNETVFNKNPGGNPEYLMGHLDIKYLKRKPGGRSRSPSWEESWDKRFDRPLSGNTRGFIHVHPHLETPVSPYDPNLSTSPSESPLASSLVDELQLAPNLNARVTSYHHWLGVKLCDMIFHAAVDPVTAIVGCRYDEITSIKSALHLVVMLLDEISRVIAVFPEAHKSTLIKGFSSKQTLRKLVFGKLRLQGSKTSKMLNQLDRGWEADINSHNGYFIRRAKQLGVECPNNEMVVAMVKAKRGMYAKEMQDHVPFEITSRPHGDLY